MKNLGIRLFSFCVLMLFLAGTVAAAGVLVPVGRAVGLEVETGGLTVAGFQEIADNPARRAGLHPGDVILRVDGQKVPDADSLRALVDRAKTTLVVTVYRDNKEENLSLKPRETDSGKQLGIYVRKGITGIGTVTYYDPETGRFGALGHGVSSPGGGLFPMEQGTVLEARVDTVKKGRMGTPGQLHGSFAQPIGSLEENTVCGVFGRTEIPFPGTPLPIAAEAEIQKGPARILSNVSGTQVQAYNVEILRLYPQDDTRNLLLKVTDPALLTQTGGIVCGMSGSPILQNGKLIGAVTHVLVNDPTQGYGIFIENMLDAAG